MRYLYLIILVIFVLVKSNGQNTEKLSNPSFEDLSAKCILSDTIGTFYLNDINNVKFDYKITSDWQAGAMDDYFTVKFNRKSRIKINSPQDFKESKYKLYNGIRNSTNSQLGYLKVKIYQNIGNKLKETKINKKQLVLIEQSNSYYLLLSFLNNLYNSLIIEISYQFESKLKSDLIWTIDNYPRNNSSFNAYIPEIYNYNVIDVINEKKAIKTKKTQITGPIIGYKMIVGFTNSGLKLFPKEWVEREQSGRSYRKVNCMLNSYECDLVSDNIGIIKGEKTLLIFKLIEINEIGMK